MQIIFHNIFYKNNKQNQKSRTKFKIDFTLNMNSTGNQAEILNITLDRASRRSRPSDASYKKGEKRVPPIIGLQVATARQSDGASTAREPFTKAIAQENNQQEIQDKASSQVQLDNNDYSAHDNSQVSRKTRVGRKGRKSSRGNDSTGSQRASSRVAQPNLVINKDDTVDSQGNSQLQLSRYEERFEKSFHNEPKIKGMAQRGQTRQSPIQADVEGADKIKFYEPNTFDFTQKVNSTSPVRAFGNRTQPLKDKLSPDDKTPQKVDEVRDSTEWMASRLPPASSGRTQNDGLVKLGTENNINAATSQNKPSHRMIINNEGNVTTLQEDSSMSKTEQNFMNLFDKSTSQLDMNQIKQGSAMYSSDMQELVSPLEGQLLEGTIDSHLSKLHKRYSITKVTVTRTATTPPPRLEQEQAQKTYKELVKRANKQTKEVKNLTSPKKDSVKVKKSKTIPPPQRIVELAKPKHPVPERKKKSPSNDSKAEVFSQVLEASREETSQSKMSIQPYGRSTQNKLANVQEALVKDSGSNSIKKVNTLKTPPVFEDESPLVGDNGRERNTPAQRPQRNSIIQLYQCDYRSTPSAKSPTAPDFQQDLMIAGSRSLTKNNRDETDSEVQMRSASADPKDLIMSEKKSSQTRPSMVTAGPQGNLFDTSGQKITLEHNNIKIDSPSKLPRELLVTPERRRAAKKQVQPKVAQVNLIAQMPQRYAAAVPVDRDSDLVQMQDSQQRQSKSIGGSKTTLQKIGSSYVSGIQAAPSVGTNDPNRQKATEPGQKLSSNPSFVRPFDNSQRSNSYSVMLDKTGSRVKLDSIKRRKNDDGKQVFSYAIDEKSESIPGHESIVSGTNSGPYQAILYQNAGNQPASHAVFEKAQVQWEQKGRDSADEIHQLVEGPLIDPSRRPSEAEQFNEHLLKRAHLSEAFLLAQNKDAASRLQAVGQRIKNENENSGYILGHQHGARQDFQNSKGDLIREEDEMLAEMDEEAMLASREEKRFLAQQQARENGVDSEQVYTLLAEEANAVQHLSRHYSAGHGLYPQTDLTAIDMSAEQIHQLQDEQLAAMLQQKIASQKMIHQASNASKTSWLQRDSTDSAKIIPVKEGWVMLDGDADDEYFNKFFKVQKSQTNSEFEELKQRIQANEAAARSSIQERQPNTEERAQVARGEGVQTPAYEEEDLEIQLPTLEEFQDLGKQLDLKQNVYENEKRAPAGRYVEPSIEDSVLRSLQGAGSIASLDQHRGMIAVTSQDELTRNQSANRKSSNKTPTPVQNLPQAHPLPNPPMPMPTEISEARIETDEELNVKNFTGKLSNYLIGEDCDATEEAVPTETIDEQTFTGQHSVPYPNPLPPASLKPPTGSQADISNLQDRIEQSELTQYQRNIRNVHLRHLPVDLWRISERQDEYTQRTNGSATARKERGATRTSQKAYPAVSSPDERIGEEFSFNMDSRASGVYLQSNDSLIGKEAQDKIVGRKELKSHTAAPPSRRSSIDKSDPILIHNGNKHTMLKYKSLRNTPKGTDDGAGAKSGRSWKRSNPSSEDSKSNGLPKGKSPLNNQTSPRTRLASRFITSEPDQLLTNEEDYQVINQLFATPRMPEDHATISGRPSIVLVRKGPSAALSKEQFDELGDLSKTPLIRGKTSITSGMGKIPMNASGQENLDDSLVQMGSIQPSKNRESKSILQPPPQDKSGNWSIMSYFSIGNALPEPLEVASVSDAPNGPNRDGSSDILRKRKLQAPHSMLISKEKRNSYFQDSPAGKSANF